MDVCKYCGSENLEVKEKFPHVGLWCVDCGKFQTWIKQKLKVADLKPATDAQQKYALALLNKWKYTNKPMTTRQAGGIINLFKE